MTVTEIALLHLLSGTSISDPSLRSKLAHAKKVMQDYTSRKFYFYQQIEDPSYIYVIGEWDSLEQHMNDFIPGDANQQALKSLEGMLEVDYLLHIDASHAELPLPKDGQAKGVISIVRHFVTEEKKDEFRKSFEENKHYLQDFMMEGKIGGGWRVDAKQGEEEWVLLCPWKNVEQHTAFASTEGFEKYGAIKEWISGAEMKHAKVLDI